MQIQAQQSDVDEITSINLRGVRLSNFYNVTGSNHKDLELANFEHICQDLLQAHYFMGS